MRLSNRKITCTGQPRLATFIRCLMYFTYLTSGEMEQLIANLVASGISRERIDKARRRGIAYQCLWCYNLKGTKQVNIKCRMEEHITKTHLEKEEMPFRCLLCGYVCMSFMKLESHTRDNAKHVLQAAKRKVLDHRPFLWINPSPHVFTAQDYLAYNPEASLLHFLGIFGQASATEGQGEETQSSEDGEEPTPGPMDTAGHGPTGEKAGPLATSLPEIKQPVMTTAFPAATPGPKGSPVPASGQQGPTWQATPVPTTGSQPTSSLPFGMSLPATLRQADPMWPVMSVAPHLSPLIPQVTPPPAAVAVTESNSTGISEPSLSIGEQLTALINRVTGPSSTLGSPVLGQSFQMNVTFPNLQPVNDQTDPQLVFLTAEPLREGVIEPLSVRDEEEPAVSEASGQTMEKAGEAVSDTTHRVMENSGEVASKATEQAMGNDGEVCKVQENARDSVTEAREQEGSGQTEVKLEGPVPKNDAEEEGHLNAGDGNTDGQDQEEVMDQTGEDETAECRSVVPEDDVLSLQDDDMAISTGKREREIETCAEKEDETKSKKPRCELDVDIVDLSNKTMLEIVERSLKANERSMGLSERSVKAIIDNTCVISKFTDAINRLTKAIESHDREERRREERRIEMERRREDEWRKALGRLRDEERRWESRRRDMEAREREERKAREEKKNQEERKSERKSEGKENDSRPKSVLGRIYTKNTISEGSSKEKKDEQRDRKH